MKLTKKNLFAIGAAVMMTASLAATASAASLTGAPIDGDGASVEIVDVDLSAMDFSQVLEGTPVAANAPIDGDADSFELVKVGVARVAGTEAADADWGEWKELDLSQMLLGEPVVLRVDVDIQG